MEDYWPPTAARLLCYGCGVKFADEMSKKRCRLCFDVFCAGCIAGEAHMPASYKYDKPQLVCRTCQNLIALFPTFLGPLESDSSAARSTRAALLSPNYCCVVLSSTLSRDTSHDTGGGPRNLGMLERLSQWVTKGTRSFDCTDVKSLTLGSFRPISPDTKICVGSQIFLPVGQITDIAAENGVLTISVKPQNPEKPEAVRVLVGSVPMLATASLLGRAPSVAGEGDVHDSHSMVFTVDPDAAAAVATSLKDLRKHLRQHFAFSRAAACISPSMSKDPQPMRPSTQQQQILMQAAAAAAAAAEGASDAAAAAQQPQSPQSPQQQSKAAASAAAVAVKKQEQQDFDDCE